MGGGFLENHLFPDSACEGSRGHGRDPFGPRLRSLRQSDADADHGAWRKSISRHLRNPGIDKSPINSNKQSLPMASKWCERISSTSSRIELSAKHRGFDTSTRRLNLLSKDLSLLRDLLRNEFRTFPQRSFPRLEIKRIWQIHQKIRSPVGAPFATHFGIRNSGCPRIPISWTHAASQVQSSGEAASVSERQAKLTCASLQTSATRAAPNRSLW